MNKEASAAPAEETVRPQFRLKLDHDDIYFGAEPFKGIAGAGDVILDHAPDNVAGRYRWSREHNRLEPLPKEKQKEEPGAPTLEQAFYELTSALLDVGALKAPLPRRLTAWLAAFEKSIESGGGTTSKAGAS